MLQCKDIVNEANDYLDGQLPFMRRIGLFLHLIVCGCCRVYLQQMRETIRTMHILKATAQQQTPKEVSDLAESLRQLHAASHSDCSHKH